MYGITCHGGSLIYCTHSNGIRSFNMSTRKSIEIIPGSTREFMYTYITSDNNYIYLSNTHSNSNIYVTGSTSNNVVVISLDGKQAKQLLCISDGINNPRVIYNDEDRNHLLVANESGSANLYEVS